MAEVDRDLEIMASMKVSAPPIFARSVRTGKCSAMASPAENRSIKSGRARTASSNGFDLLPARCCYSSGHFLRVAAASLARIEPQGARHFLLGTASLSTLTYEHDPSEAAIGLWNDTHHVSAQCLEESK